MANTKAIELKTRVGVDGETSYKQALDNIGRKLRVLKSDMKATTSAFGENQKSVEALKARQAALASQQAAHTEKVQILTEMLDVAKEKFGENSEEADVYRIRLANASTELNKCTTELDKTGQELEDAQKAAEGGSDANQELAGSAKGAGDAMEQQGQAAEKAKSKGTAFSKVMAGAAKTLKGAFVASAKAAAAAFTAVSAAAAAAVTAGFGLSVTAGKYADDLLTLSSQTGVTAETLQKWSYASNFIDTSVETMTGSMARMIRAMGDAKSGSEGAQEKFDALGVSITDMDGNLRDSEDVFWDCIDALGEIQNPTERDAAAMDLFGKSAQDLNPLIEAGRGAFQELGDEAERLGVVFSDEELATMGGFDDAMQQAKASAEGLKNTIGLVLIPAFQPLVENASDAMGKVSSAIKDGLTPEEADQLMKDLAGNVKDALDSLTRNISDALPAVTAALEGLLKALADKLPELASNVLPGAMSLMQSVLDSITANAEGIGRVAGELVGQLATFIVQALPKVIGAIGPLLSGLLQGLGEGLLGLWNQIISSVTGWFEQTWQSVKDWIEGKVTNPNKHAASNGQLYGGGTGQSFGEDTVVPDNAGDQIASQVMSGVTMDMDAATNEAMASVQAAVEQAMAAAGETMTPEEGKETGSQWMGGITEGITATQEDVKGAATTALGAALEALQESVDGGGFVGIGRSIGEGIAVGIRTSTGKVVAAARSAARSAYTAAKAELDIRSPSHKAQWLGEEYDEGMALGMEKRAGRIREAARALSGIALTETRTAHGREAFDYGQMGDATAAALRHSGVGQGGIDYDRVGAAVAQANREAGVGRATIVMDKRAVGRTVEPDVNRETRSRGSRTIDGRPGVLVMG